MNDELEPVGREQLLCDIRQLLPRPVQETDLNEGRCQLIGGDPADIVVVLDEGRVTVSEFAVDPQASPPDLRAVELGTLNWANLPAWIIKRIMTELIATGVAMRRSKYRRCARCNKENPPEQMQDERTCQQCAQQDMGVVF